MSYTFKKALVRKPSRSITNAISSLGANPDYEKVIPKDERDEIKADAIKFSNALDRLRALSSDRKGVVKIKIENNNITFNIKDITHGGMV